MTDIKKSKDSDKVEDVEVDVDEVEENGASAAGGAANPPSIKRPETEEEKKRKRLERFGLSLKADGENEADRKKKRLERFGSTAVSAATDSSSTKSSGLTEAEKLEKRKNKFGTLTEADKQKKREKKFRQNANNGNANKNKNGGKQFNVQAKTKEGQRAANLGLPVKSNQQKALQEHRKPAVLSLEEIERQKKREQRFAGGSS